MSESLPGCLHCGKVATQLCARCRAVAFCDRICQRSAWASHKVVCAPFGTAIVVRKAPASKSGVALPVAPVVVTGALSFVRIVALLRDNLGDAAFVEQGMKALYLKIPDDSSARSALDAGAMVPVAAALRLYGTSARVLESAAGVLQNLTIVDVGVEAALDASVVPCIVAALQTYLEDALTCRPLSAALFHISDVPAGRDTVLAAHAIAPLLRAMRVHALDMKICHSACAFMSGLMAAGSAVERAELVAAGAIPLLAAALRDHCNGVSTAFSAMICVSACTSLGAMTDSAGCVDDVLAAGALPPLVSALQVYLKDARISYRANRTLWNIALDGERYAEVIAAGALPLFIVSFQTHLRDIVNCKQGISIIHDLAALSPEARNAVKCAGAAALLIEALQIYACERSDGVVEMASRALVALCDWGGECSIAVDAVPALVAVLRLHWDHELVCNNVCSIFISSFTFSAGRAAAVALGCDEIARLFALALRTHAERAQTTQLIVMALSHLAANPACRAALAAAEVFESLVTTLRKYELDAGICRNTCSAIKRLVVASNVRVQVVSSGIIPLLVSILRAHVENVEACDAAAGVLVKCLLRNEITPLKDDVIAAGAEEALKAVAARHSQVACPSDSLSPLQSSAASYGLQACPSILAALMLLEVEGWVPPS